MIVSGRQRAKAEQATQVSSFKVDNELLRFKKLSLQKAIIMPNLILLSSTQQICQDWPHLKGLRLADFDYDKPSTVDDIRISIAYRA
jgi:hypothetical protein